LRKGQIAKLKGNNLSLLLDIASIKSGKDCTINVVLQNKKKALAEKSFGFKKVKGPFDF
jgi:hypothetical protein